MYTEYTSLNFRKVNNACNVIVEKNILIVIERKNYLIVKDKLGLCQSL